MPTLIQDYTQMDVITISAYAVYNLLVTMYVRKGIETGGIPLKVLICVAVNAAPALASLSYLSMALGDYLIDLQHDQPDAPGNYTIITLTSLFRKLIEGILYTSITVLISRYHVHNTTLSNTAHVLPASSSLKRGCKKAFESVYRVIILQSVIVCYSLDP